MAFRKLKAKNLLILVTDTVVSTITFSIESTVTKTSLNLKVEFAEMSLVRYNLTKVSPEKTCS